MRIKEIEIVFCKYCLYPGYSEDIVKVYNYGLLRDSISCYETDTVLETYCTVCQRKVIELIIIPGVGKVEIDDDYVCISVHYIEDFREIYRILHSSISDLEKLIKILNVLAKYVSIEKLISLDIDCVKYHIKKIKEVELKTYLEFIKENFPDIYVELVSEVI